MINVVYSPPVIRQGDLYRGVVATDDVDQLLAEITRDKWVLLWLGHGAVSPEYHPDIDLYQTDPFFGSSCPNPQVYVVLRELSDSTKFRPTGAVKQFDVVFNACWDKVKRPEILIEALTYARDEGRPITCLWFGYHWHKDHREVERWVISEVRSRDLPVTFEPTDYDAAVVNQRYNRCRAAVMCSASEAGPRVMSEALLADLPYVTTRDTVGGSPAYIDANNGALCDPNAESVAKSLWHVLDHPSEYRPRQWALANMCLTVGLSRLRDGVGQVASDRDWRVNLADLTFRGTDWGGREQHVQKAEAAIR